jgi:hypothetical protein
MEACISVWVYNRGTLPGPYPLPQILRFVQQRVVVRCGLNGLCRWFLASAYQARGLPPNGLHYFVWQLPMYQRFS